jgi:hypothetical protein
MKLDRDGQAIQRRAGRPSRTFGINNLGNAYPRYAAVRLFCYCFGCIKITLPRFPCKGAPRLRSVCEHWTAGIL